jgi:uncharacterized protein (TIGR02594 family)
VTITPYQLASRYLGVRERAGAKHHPLITWWLSLCRMGSDAADEIPWCSAFVNGIAWELDLARSNSAAARSWLTVGSPVSLLDATADADIVILSRGSNPASGHVGFYAGHSEQTVSILGGNQSNAVTIQAFDKARILGVRRLA